MKVNRYPNLALRPYHLAFGALILAVTFAGRCGDLPASFDGDVPVGGAGLGKRQQSQFVSPFRIANGPGNTQFVSDFRAGHVYQILSTGGLVTQIKNTYPAGDFASGIAFSDGLLYVGDAETGAVAVIEISKSATGARSVNATFQDPTDIAADSAANRLYVLDAGARQVQVVDTDTGELVQTISSAGLSDETLQNPTGIAVNPLRQEVMVSDYGDLEGFSPYAAVKVFGYDGTFKRSFRGKQGWFGGGRFTRIQGMAVDALGRIYVVESMAGEVQVLDPDTGETVGVYGTYGTNPGELWLPLDVVLDNAGNLVVTSNRSRTVEVLNGTAPKAMSATYTPDEGMPASKTMALLPQHECNFCHNLHGGSSDRLLAAAGFEAVCMTCHGPGGQAVQVENHTYPTGLSKPGVYQPSTCSDCHVPHDNVINRKGGTNIKLVKAWVSIESASGTMPRPMTFEARGSDYGEPSARSFCDLDNDGDGVWDSPCDTCHNINNTTVVGDNPARHRWNDDARRPDHHNAGRGCTEACHTHVGFFDKSPGSQG